MYIEYEYLPSGAPHRSNQEIHEDSQAKAASISAQSSGAAKSACPEGRRTQKVILCPARAHSTAAASQRWWSMLRPP